MISNKCYYALRAVLELAKREGSGPVTINQVARAQSIPPRFLEAILRELKQAGLTDSIRGKEGGYLLNQAAAGISVGDVVRIIQGPLIQINAEQPESSTPPRPDVFQRVWKEAETNLSSVYDGITFRQLADEDASLSESGAIHYTI